MRCHDCGHEQAEGRYCGRCGALVGDEAASGTSSGDSQAGAEERESEPGGAAGAGSPRRSAAATSARSWKGGWLVAVAVGGVAVLALTAVQQEQQSGAGTQQPQSDTSTPASMPSAAATSPVSDASTMADREPLGFASATDVVLLFDDGADGALAVDPDTGAQRHIALPGQQPGDRPFRLLKVGESLVVGQGDIHAVALPGGRSRELAEGDLVLPHVTADRMWVIDHVGPNGGLVSWTLMDAAGKPLDEARVDPARWQPVRGVPGGLAVQRPDGSLHKYDVAQREIVDYLGDGPAWIADVAGDRVVWCDQDPCQRLHVTAARDTTVGSGETFYGDRIWISEDGRTLAAVVTVAVGGGIDFRLRIYRIDTGEVLADTQMMLGDAYGAWSPDGDQFFSWVHSPGAAGPALLSRWTEDEAIEQIDVRERGIEEVYDLIVLPSDTGDELF